MISSLRWPGAFTVAKNGVYCNIYVGDCIKRGDNTFIPTDPPEVLNDPLERDLQTEPQGKDAPVNTGEEENKEDGEED